MAQKIRVGVLFGGRSAEHEVSLQSARNVVEAIDRSKYEVVLIGIDKEGQWRLSGEAHFLLDTDNPALARLNQVGEPVALLPGAGGQPELTPLSSSAEPAPLDVVFPVLHGTYGEDGTVQGLLKLANMPFVGAGVLGSAVGMDKDVMKRLLRDAGIPIARFQVLRSTAPQRPALHEVAEDLGLPVFVKPANLGSSVGVHKVEDEADWARALEDAFHYDTKLVIEEFVEGREVECSVLGNEDPIASVPGEVIPQHDFYSYEAKYIDEHGARLEIPARLPDHVARLVQARAREAFQALCCEGMARVDAFVTSDERVLVNEINTIPGFTRISMYPKLWEASGIPYSRLIDRLIELALERFQRESRLKTSYQP